MKRKPIAYLIFLTLIALIALFSGCAQAENTTPVETPADVSPTSTPEQEIVQPTPTPVEEWNKTFGGGYKDEAYSVQQTSDGGYIFAGKYTSSDNRIGVAWLLKTDANGNELWNQTFKKGKVTTSVQQTPYGESIISSGAGTYARSVQQTPDGGYILLGGGTYDGSTKILLIKTDALGTLIWEKIFEDGDVSRGGAVQLTSDGGYIIANRFRGMENDDAWLIKTNAQGNEQWNRTFGEPYFDGATSVQPTLDGGYVVAGETQHFGSGGAMDSWLIKTDSQGNEQWNRTFGGPHNDRATSVQPTLDGGYIIVGEGIDLIKTDANGIEQWNKSLGSLASSIQRTSDGGYVITGISIAHENKNLIKVDSNGNEQWSMTLGAIHSVQQTSDGGYILVGLNQTEFPASSALLTKIEGVVIEETTEVKPPETKRLEEPIEKTSGFELVLAMMSLIVMYTVKRKER